MGQELKAAVARQRVLLSGMLSAPIERLAQHCAELWPNRDALESLLKQQMQTLPSCKYLYVLDAQARQITANVTARGLLPDQFGRDRSQRPYLAGALAGERFTMSDAYLSRNARRPSLTAVQRIESPMDQRIDEVLDLLTELVAVHGVFHGKLHFSSSRATLWFINDPLRYRILDIEDLTDPGIVLTYRRDPYPEDAVIPLEKVGEVFRTFRELRFMDETIYLRAGSLNIFNGMVGLNFSCDGSHYMPWDEFLEKSLGFWLGTGESIITRENQRNTP